jgi:transcriptional regulator with XRE-family HTH domain
MAQYKDKILLRKTALHIKQIRHNAAITLDDFYVDTGIHLARIEQGKTNLSLSTLKQICTYFNISLSEFFTELENN